MIKSTKIGVGKAPRKLRGGVYSTISIIVPEFCIELRNYRKFFVEQPSKGFLIDTNELFMNLKSTGNYYKLDRMGLFAAEIQQHARVDLINPFATQITEVNAPTWTAGLGYKGDGSTKYLNTNFALSNATHYTQNSAAYGVYILENIQENGADIGATHGASRRTALHTRFPTNTAFTLCNESGSASYVNSDSSGMYVVKRNGAIRNDYRNNVNVRAVGSSTSESPSSFNVFLLGRNENGTLGFPSTRRNAMYFIGSGELDHSAFYSAFQYYATKRGFAV